jgi:hypothetical protein
VTVVSVVATFMRRSRRYATSVAHGPIKLTVSYDEFDIDAAVAYSGLVLERWLETEDGHRRQAAGGVAVIKLHFRQ